MARHASQATRGIAIGLETRRWQGSGFGGQARDRSFLRGVGFGAFCFFPTFSDFPRFEHFGEAGKRLVLRGFLDFGELFQNIFGSPDSETPQGETPQSKVPPTVDFALPKHYPYACPPDLQ
jgi:hypothetical protein